MVVMLACVGLLINIGRQTGHVGRALHKSMEPGGLASPQLS
jgi:hypothetical protein